jgi:CheY-like chemotaxis protein
MSYLQCIALPLPYRQLNADAGELSMGSASVSHKVLIIDDEDDIREVAALSLESVAGWEVVTANSGSQGLARAAEHQPDVILLDVMMPGMDGPTTFRELRKNPATAKIPVLLLTAKVQSSDQRRFADLGVEAVLFKPFDPLTLSDQIAGVLGWN